MRRVKVFGLVVLLFLVTVLFWTGSLSQHQALNRRSPGDFYQKTVDALNNEGPLSQLPNSPGDDNDEAVAMAMRESLQKAADVAKGKANAKAAKPDPPSSVIGVGNSAEVAKGNANAKATEPDPPSSVVRAGNSAEVSQGSVVGSEGLLLQKQGQDQKPITEETNEEQEVTAELNSILEKSPSKSCLQNNISLFSKHEDAN